jgi:hypothetical protein
MWCRYVAREHFEAGGTLFYWVTRVTRVTPLFLLTFYRNPTEMRLGYTCYNWLTN